MTKRKFRLIAFFICIAIPLIPGFIVGLLTSGQNDIYNTIKTPSFAPPSILFPIAWSILYVLMGISLYLIYRNSGTRTNYILFTAQLVVNLLWPVFFFTFQAFSFSFVWLIILWLLIFAMILSFYKTFPAAAYLQIPYLLWVTFAGVLNFAIAALN